MTPGMDPLYWRLLYPIREPMSESLTNASIQTAPPFASELQIVKASGTPIVRIPLAKGERPIFYRCRSAGLDGSGATHLEATVFGRAWDAGTQIDATLWAAIDGRIINCPEDLAAGGVVEFQCSTASRS